MNIIKKRTALLILAGLLLSCFGCSASGVRTQSPPPENSITDASGAVLEIPDREHLRIASVYAVSVPFLVALGLSEDVVAINCKSRFWTDNVPALGQAGSAGRGVVDLEALASFAPDVLIHRTNDPKTAEAVSALGIQVLCIKVESLEDVKDTLRMMGRYFGREERAEDIITYMEDKLALIDSIVADIPMEARFTALTLGGEYGRVAGEDMLQSAMIEKAGGISAAWGITNNSSWAQIGTERVFALDPDFLFLTGSTALDYTREELCSDPTWGAMACVKNNRVHQIPSRLDSWDLPGVVSVIGIMWMLHQMYPEWLSAEQLQAEINEYYGLMFGRTFEPDYLGYSLE